MAVAKEQIRQIISQNNLNSVACLFPPQGKLQGHSSGVDGG